MASEEAERQFNKKAEPHTFLPDQLVLLDEHSFLAKNQKLAPKWSGPHKILCLKGECNVELLLRHNNKKLITHVNQLKPYFVPKSAAVSSPDFFPAQKAATPPPAAPENDKMENFLHDNGYIEREVTDTDPYAAENIMPPHPRRCRTTSSSSSLYDEYTRPADLSSPTPTYAQIVTHKQHARTSSSSSSASLRPPPQDSIAGRTRSRSPSWMPERPKLYMPQISAAPLPVLNEGEDLEENEDVAINILDEHS